MNLERLSIELDSILIEDQKFRSEIVALQNQKSDSVELQRIWEKQRKLDSSNLVRVEQIINQINGFPGKSLVGSSASKAAFLVLQHAPIAKQGKYLDIILEAAKKNELDKGLAAMYHDRYLMYNGKPQIYGTQIRSFDVKNPETGNKEKVNCIWPIADTTNIDSLRLWNGLIPLKDYLGNFGIVNLTYCD
ncbi:DUF6624 domain-containing protein [Flagellimonas meridianipacifica]|uniref:Uncharacterized protein n=1 Tax=Flagellimonas meridianipacifica TaxID=1080225 RepID=A0A2T0MCP5_9FLAO|nr:DUF6624 domain-containing protein [Allomuricauda pacifica]PRX55262.1 hypothetical protein CLV81_3671 [Allomuricauda pacifica]